MVQEKKEETITVFLPPEEMELTDKLLELVATVGQAVGKYTFLPLDTIVALDELTEYYPGLRWVLRKKRGNRYELKVLRSKHLEDWEAKGEP